MTDGGRMDGEMAWRWSERSERLIKQLQVGDHSEKDLRLRWRVRRRRQGVVFEEKSTKSATASIIPKFKYSKMHTVHIKDSAIKNYNNKNKIIQDKE